ncbi:hypothetical protein RUM44_010639 [Polyplax serrata]|uniref:Major facilitator superfamily (MFS) profile domain-containing protein n=1 Tax=Polyplax serrata TaxID=468196 RepID=A0ABR1AMS0_POLSC
MEPTVDTQNNSKAPLARWDEGSLPSLDGKDTEMDNQGKSDTLTVLQEVKALTRNGNAVLSNGSTVTTDEVKFLDPTGRILEINVADSFSSKSSSLPSAKRRKPKVPDGGWGWVVVFSSFVISLIADGVSYSFGLLYIEFLNYFQESKSKTSWIGSLFMAVPLLLGPIMSALVDRYGCRSMTILGGLISGLGFVIASFGNSIEWEFIFFGVVAGSGLGLCYVTAVVSIAYWFDKYRTLAIGLGACGTGVGTLIYAPLTQFLIEEYGWRGTVLLLAGTFFNMCVCGALMRDPKWLSQEVSKQESLKNVSSYSTMQDAEVQSNGNSSFYLSTNADDNSKFVQYSEGCNLPTVRSAVNLPTFLNGQEKVPVEVLEQFSNNRMLLDALLDNYSPLLQFNNKPDKTKSRRSSEDSQKLHSGSKPGTNTNSLEKTPIGADKNCIGNVLPSTESQQTSLPSNRNGILKSGKDSGQHYLKGIRLHRNSVMYRGAMLNIPKYRLRASSCPDIFRNSMTTIAKENEEKWYADILELLKTMFDFSMFVELHFLLISVATILLFIWLIVPYFYLAEHVTRRGYTEVEASFLLSIIGVANFFGMIGLGWAGDQPWMNVTKTYAVCLTLCGLTCIFMPIATDSFNALAALSGLFGLFFASNYSFTPSIVVQLIPLERFTTAYGLILLCQGIGCLVGPPLAGWIFDMMGEWDLSFYLAGGWIIFSAILTILIQFTKNRKIWGSGKLEMEKIHHSVP